VKADRADMVRLAQFGDGEPTARAGSLGNVMDIFFALTAAEPDANATAEPRDLIHVEPFRSVHR